jgi:hypothetical protein
MALPFLLPNDQAKYLAKTETSLKCQLIIDMICIMKCGFVVRGSIAKPTRESTSDDSKL